MIWKPQWRMPPKRHYDCTVELPPIREVWREASALTFSYPYPRNYTAEQNVRRQNLAKVIRSVRTLISLEEAFGPGLLDRMTSTSLWQAVNSTGRIGDDLK